MPTRLIARLEQHGPLFDDEKQALRSLPSQIKIFEARQEIVTEGSEPQESVLILEGFACRYKHLANGRRQITAFHVPCDFADLGGFLLKRADDGIGALTHCKVAIIPHTRLRRITNEFPFLARVLWLTTLIDSSVHREWMTRIGRRSAKQRVAHVLCEMAARLKVVGLLNDTSFELPITQVELADAIGVSSVHMNRVLQDLRHDGLITTRAHTVTINDQEQLCKVAQFSLDYLHVRLHVERD